MKSKILLGLRIIAAGILIQTLYFKFTGAPESKFIFSTLGVEPWGRYFAGISELVAGIFLLIPALYLFGAMMSIGIMLGAITSHLLILGIQVQNDGGLLFSLALIVFIICITIVVLEKENLKKLIQQLKLKFLS